MVVTDCTNALKNCDGQKIIYSTDTDAEWKQKLSAETLSNSFYSILRNPPPILTETEFASSRSEIPNLTGNINDGEIIGRVYYVRGIPPKLNSDLATWLEKSIEDMGFSDSKAGGYYSLIFYMSLAIAVATISCLEFTLYICRERQRQDKRHKDFKKETNKKIQKYEELKQEANLKIKNYERETNEKDQNIETLTRSKNILTEEIHSFQRQNRNLDIARQQRKNELLNKINLLEQQVKSISQSEREIEQNAVVISQLKEQISRLELQTQENDKNYQQQITDLQTNIDNKNQELDNQSKKLQNNIEQKLINKEKIDNLVQYNLIYKDYIKAYKKQYKNLKEDYQIIHLYEEDNLKLREKLAEYEEHLKIKLLYIEDNNRLNEDNDSLRNKLEKCKTEKDNIIAEHNNIKSTYDKLSKNYNEKSYISNINSKEKEFYYKEKIDIVLEVLNQNINNITDNTRKYHIIRDILDNNNISEERTNIENELKRIFNKYDRFNNRMEQDLKGIGFEVVSQNEHIKVIYKRDSRYTFQLSKSPGC